MLGGRSFAAAPYRVTTVAVPEEAFLEVGGLAANPDGRLLVATRRGEVWGLQGGRWKRFASGLHECMGLAPGERAGECFVLQRGELTRLVDTDEDGVADRYETVCDKWGLSGNYHEYAFGVPRDKEGNFYGTLNLSQKRDGWGGPYMGAHPETPWRGWSFRVTPKGEFQPWSVGLRAPNGVGVSPDGDAFCMDNQGEWVAAGSLHHLAKGAFHGNPSGLIFRDDFKGRDPKTVPLDELAKLRKLPAVVFPYPAMGQSQGEPRWDTTGGEFGPYAGQCFVPDVQLPMLMRASLEKVAGQYQGACYPFLRLADAGNNRLLFAPDGALYVGLTDRGWGKGNLGLRKVAYTGALPFDILTMSLTQTGFDLTFTKPVDAKAAADVANYGIYYFHYNYGPQYGSPEVDKTPVTVSAARVAADGRRVSLTLPLRAPKIYALRIAPALTAADGSTLFNATAYYTLNALRK